MILLPVMTSKRFSALVTGELFAFDFGGQRALAIRIARRQGDDYDRIAVLCAEALVNVKPFHDFVDDDFVCLSYGTEWLISVTNDAATFPNRFVTDEDFGHIYTYQGGNGIRLNRPQGNGGARLGRAFVDLQGFVLSPNVPPNAAPSPHWSLWPSVEAFEHGALQPLFSI